MDKFKEPVRRELKEILQTIEDSMQAHDKCILTLKETLPGASGTALYVQGKRDAFDDISRTLRGRILELSNQPLGSKIQGPTPREEIGDVKGYVG